MAVVKSVARYRWVILGIAFIAQLGIALASLVVAPLAPLFQPELGLSKAEVGLFASAAYAGAWGVLLVAGSITDRIGPRVVMSLGQIVAGAVMASMALVGSFYQALAVMFVVGLGRGTVAPGITKTVVDWFPPGARGTVMGLKQTGVPLAGVITASTLPAVGLLLGWRAAIAVVGMLIVAGGIVTLILYRDAPQPAQSAGRRVSMRAGLGRVLRNRHIWTLSTIATLYSTVQTAVVAHLALYFKEVMLVPWVPDEHTRIVVAGGYLALGQMGGVAARIFWGVVSDRLFQGRRLVVLAIIGGLASVMSLVVGYLQPGYPLWLLTAIVFIYGAGAIGWNGLYQALIAETAGRRYAATGVGFSMTMSQLGTVGGPPLFGFIVDFTGSYQMAFLFLAGFSAAGMATALVSAREEKHVE